MTDAPTPDMFLRLALRAQDDGDDEVAARLTLRGELLHLGLSDPGPEATIAEMVAAIRDRPRVQ